MIFQIFSTVVALVFIFIWSINKFSHQIERVTGEKFRTTLKHLTKNPLIGTIAGTGITSVLQSSTATTVMTVGLVNAGMLTFAESLGIIFGANIGTTITSQLIALNVTAVAPFIIVLGILVLKFGGKYHIYGKSVFYFGMVFFSISLITQVVAPLASDPEILSVMAKIHSIPLAILAGIILTTIFQSSSVTSGLFLALAASGVINFEQGVGFILGANIGTTSTALLAAIPMDIEAKKAALAHFVFNVAGVILVLPFLEPFTGLIERMGGTVVQQIANAHFFFNVLATAVSLLLVKQFSALIEMMSRSKLLHVRVKGWETRI